MAAVAVAIGGLSASAFAPSTAVAATSPTTASELSTAKDGKVATILVAGNTTVYTLKPSKTACDAKCLKLWLPVLLPPDVTTPTAGSGVDESKLDTVAAADGALQMTYGGKALYWFAKDKAPGQVHGNVSDKWGKWAMVVTKKGPDFKSGGGSDVRTGGAAF